MSLCLNFHLELEEEQALADKLEGPGVGVGVRNSGLCPGRAGLWEQRARPWEGWVGEAGHAPGGLGWGAAGCARGWVGEQRAAPPGAGQGSGGPHPGWAGGGG